MKILGIAAEYNPFHNGHKYHIEKSKELTGCDAAVGIMSGFFTQRGEPVISDKWQRAEIAVSHGLDLVIELPFIYACNGASRFAEGAAGILNGLGCIDVMSFGSEAGDIAKLEKCAFVIDETEFKSRDRSYAVNAGEIFEECGIKADPNNILAIEYIKALHRLGSDIKPFTIKRNDRGYNIDGASSIRERIFGGSDVSELVPEVPSMDWDGKKETLFKLAASEILKQPPEILDLVPSGGEGLGFKFRKEIRRSGSFDELVDNVRGTRYTRARISRALIQVIMGLYEMPDTPFYARILAFNEKGTEVLREIKKKGHYDDGFVLLNNINKQETSSINNALTFDIRACDMYNLIVGQDLYSHSDMTQRPAQINCR